MFWNTNCYSELIRSVNRLVSMDIVNSGFDELKMLIKSNNMLTMIISEGSGLGLTFKNGALLLL